MISADVQAKREAATRWANHVSAEPTVGSRWCYLLVSESDVETARGSWEAPKHMGQ
jgi:type III restriction enzyme